MTALRLPPSASPLAPLSQADFDRIPRERLESMAEAAMEVTSCLRALAKTKHNIVGEVLAGHGTFYEWNHYPPGDVHDPDSRSQYYYHAHATEQRFIGEHGHFHLFVRVDPPGTAQTEATPPTHLFAIAMNSAGWPIALFTTNRWVTGEHWRSAAEVIKLLDPFAIDHTKPNWALNRWITAMAKLFHPQLVRLLEQRDLSVSQHEAAHPDRDVFEDRALEVCSLAWIDTGRQIEDVKRAILRAT